MEIDLTSVIISIIALSTFFIPIGLHQFSKQHKIKEIRNSFNDAAKANSLHIDDMEVLRKGIAIGIDIQNHCILHLKNQKGTVIELDDVESCRLFKENHRESADDGTKTENLVMGIHFRFKQNQSGGIKLPLFEGSEGGLFGDEEVRIHKWINKIKSVLKSSK